MEPVLFYGVPHGCSFGSIVAFEWLNQPYRLCRIAMPVEPSETAFRRINPLGETPTLLLENGKTLSESVAILHHIGARDPRGSLAFRQGSAEFDQLNHVLAYLTTSFHTAWGPVFQPEKYATDAAAQEVVRSRSLARIADRYAHIESLLAGREWLAGDGPTIADAYLFGVARWGEELGSFNLGRDYPNLQRLLDKMKSDPAVLFAQAVEDDRPATTSGQFKGHVALEEIGGRLAA